jgi:predicted DsbA family dithiol-disulfide isomerase
MTPFFLPPDVTKSVTTGALRTAVGVTERSRQHPVAGERKVDDSMKVEIWSDIVCPFCYIGKRRFEEALSRFDDRESVEVVWRSFELDPDGPRQYPGSLDEMLARKYGTGIEQARQMNDNVTRMAAEVGLDYRLAEAKPGNTFDAHRLIHFATERGLGAKAKERLLEAYFIEGRAIGDQKTLADLATDIGLDEEEVRSVLESRAYASDVRADEARGRQLGINGVPFFVFDEKYGVSGAQGVETFEQVLARTWSESAKLTMVSGGNDSAGSCDDGSCDVADEPVGSGARGA